MNPIISIIIPIYNVEPFLHECIDSVINQTYKNLEIILVDDGSTDLSGQICDDYAKQDKRVKVIHKKNEGLGLTRNTGIRAAHGKYLCFVDGDDYVAEDFIETLYAALAVNHADLCKGGFSRVTNDHRIFSIRKYANATYNDDKVLEDFLPRFFGSAPSAKDSLEMSSCGTLYVLSTIRKNNIYFVSERIFLSEDIFFNMRYIKHIKHASVIDSVGYYYRSNPKSLSRSYRPDRFETGLLMYSELKKIILEYGYSEKELTRLSRLYFVYLKGALSQENPKKSHLNNRTMLQNIKNICYNNEVQSIINNYPISQLGIKQKIFLRLIQHKKIRTISLLVKMGII